MKSHLPPSKDQPPAYALPQSPSGMGTQARQLMSLARYMVMAWKLRRAKVLAADSHTTLNSSGQNAPAACSIPSSSA